jgi:hypothetical protein
MATDTVSPLRQRMIEDMSSRKLCAHTQRGHIHSCKRLAAFLKRSPETVTCEDLRRFQLHLAETGMSICNRNRIMTGVRFLFRVTLRRLDLAAEIYHLREPEKLPLVMSADEVAPNRARFRPVWLGQRERAGEPSGDFSRNRSKFSCKTAPRATEIRRRKNDARADDADANLGCAGHGQYENLSICSSGRTELIARNDRSRVAGECRRVGREVTQQCGHERASGTPKRQAKEKTSTLLRKVRC